MWRLLAIIVMLGLAVGCFLPAWQAVSDPAPTLGVLEGLLTVAAGVLLAAYFLWVAASIVSEWMWTAGKRRPWTYYVGLCWGRWRSGR